MAGKTIDIQGGGIMLAGRWKLFPVDARNWELCELREPSARGGKAKEGGERWFRCGRFYSYNTVEEALLYVIDELWKSSCADAARQLCVDLAGYRACVAEVRETLAGVASSATRAAGDRG